MLEFYVAFSKLALWASHLWLSKRGEFSKGSLQICRSIFMTSFIIDEFHMDLGDNQKLQTWWWMVLFLSNILRNPLFGTHWRPCLYPKLVGRTRSKTNYIKQDEVKERRLHQMFDLINTIYRLVLGNQFNFFLIILEKIY